MKEKKIAIMSWAVMLSASVFADVHYNSKTFDSFEKTSESVYIGHERATDGGSASDALVIVKNGAIWESMGSVVMGNVAGNSRFVVENGGVFSNMASSASFQFGFENNAYSIITNYGLFEVLSLRLGEDKYASSSKNYRAKFDNFGTLAVNKISFGPRKQTTPTSDAVVLHNHENAIMNVKDTGDFGFYIGDRGPGTLINEGKITSSATVRIGGVQGAQGEGRLIMSNAAEFVANNNVWIGSKGAKGIVNLYGDSQFKADSSIIYLGYKETAAAAGEGEIVLSDDSRFFAKDFVIGRAAGSKGNTKLFGNSVLDVANSLYVGASYNNGFSSVTGSLDVADNALVICTNILIGFSMHKDQWDTRKPGLSGKMVVGGNAVVSNAVISVGCVDSTRTSFGQIVLDGGTILLNPKLAANKRPLVLGSGGEFSSGIISGWGKLAFLDLYDSFVAPEKFDDCAGISHYGKIIADGGGVEKDLDCGRIGVFSWFKGVNGCGTNGWYAANKGRLKLPRSIARKAADHVTVGDNPTRTVPRLVNSFVYTLDSEARSKIGTYMFSELYSADRIDIPAGLPTGSRVHHSAVWRIGHFNSSATPDVEDTALTNDHKAEFSTLKVKFRYDPALAEIDDVCYIKVYRHDGTANGGWRCVGKAVPSVDSPFVETAEFAPSSELWNGGWFAIVGAPKMGTVMVLR
ncbi:MAG: hypothetical protein J6R18_02440 [Kiritimatiellae bacterium]|nr:hypothetical protein [Kiritimatiellia bacterium]